MFYKVPNRTGSKSEIYNQSIIPGLWAAATAAWPSPGGGAECTEAVQRLKCPLSRKQLTLACPPIPPHDKRMPSDRASLLALKNLIADTDLILETTPDPPQNRTACCRENLRAALALADDLLKQQRTMPAAALGRKGGSTTSQRHGAEHYREMAAARKTRASGRPRENN